MMEIQYLEMVEQAHALLSQVGTDLAIHMQQPHLEQLNVETAKKWLLEKHVMMETQQALMDVAQHVQ